jgi:nucleoside-diphosphate-sugar epimerase
MKIAVTGGSGQLGTLVLRRLAADPHITEIISLDLRPPRVASAKLKHVIADVRDGGIERHFENCDAVIHLAFVVMTAPARKVFDDINVGGSRNVFEAAARAGVPRIIYASSIAAYGVVMGHPIPITEEMPRIHQPTFAYSATKYEVEAFLDEFERRHPKIAVARMRPSILIGANMDHHLGDTLRRGFLVHLGPTPLPIVWDEDVADAFVLALKNNAHGAFNLSADELLPAKDLAAEGGLRAISLPPRLLKVAARLAHSFGRLGFGRNSDPAWVDNQGVPMIVSSEKARRELGWHPKYPRAADVIRRYTEVARVETDFRLLLFFKLVELASRRFRRAVPRDHLASQVHLSLTGRGGGDFGIEWKEGHLVIAQGQPPSPNVEVTMDTRTFLGLLSGARSLDSVKNDGEMQIEGEAPAALVVEEIVSRFQEQASNESLAAWPVRRMARWFSVEANA